jgi:hypothetical protein
MPKNKDINSGIEFSDCQAIRLKEDVLIVHKEQIMDFTVKTEETAGGLKRSLPDF